MSRNTASPASPTISVVVPCYNAEATIVETIQSALDQDLDCEIVAVDDGSKDGTAEALRSFGDRIVPLFGPNRGVSAARNSGVEVARGKWIQFLDSDDLLCPETLALRLASAGEADDLIVCGWREFSVDKGVVIDGRLRGVDVAAVRRDSELAFATDVWAPPAAVLYRRELVDKIGGFRADLPVIQDARHLFDAAYHGANIGHADHIGARYRVLDGSLSRRNPGQFWADVLLNGRQIETLWRERDGLTAERRTAVRDIYNQASRGLFAAGDDRFFEAAEALRTCDNPPSHVAIAAPLARALGVRTAHRLLSLVGKG